MRGPRIISRATQKFSGQNIEVQERGEEGSIKVRLARQALGRTRDRQCPNWGCRIYSRKQSAVNLEASSGLVSVLQRDMYV